MKNQLEINNLSLSAARLISTLKKPGCPVCFAQDEAVHSYLENLFYENVNDSLFRKKFENSGGFCSFHTNLVPKYGDPSGIAILYAALISSSTTLTTSVTDCLCCRISKEAQDRALDSVAELVSKDTFFENAPDDILFCRRHFSLLKKKISKSQQRAVILHQQAKLDEVTKLLKDVLRKMDYRATSEKLTQREKLALIMAVKYFAGFAQLSGYIEERL
ncbi:MAG: DUF6062 family protein [Candidatus Kryptoniota bacterium]